MENTDKRFCIDNDIIWVRHRGFYPDYTPMWVQCRLKMSLEKRVQHWNDKGYKEVNIKERFEY